MFPIQRLQTAQLHQYFLSFLIDFLLLLTLAGLLQPLPLTEPFMLPLPSDMLVSPESSTHSSRTLTRFAGSMLYCRLYKLLRCMGGMNCPETRASNTRGEI